MLSSETLWAVKKFTKPALTKARFHGISAYSLLAEDSTTPGVHIFGRYYVVMWGWFTMNWTMVPAEGFTIPASYDPVQVYRGEQSVLEWVLTFLLVNAPHCRSEGWYCIGIQFTEGTELFIAGALYKVSWLYVDALLTRHRKMTEVEWRGNYFIDWHLSAVKVLPMGSLQSSTQADFANWPDYTGPEKPEIVQGPVDLHIEVVGVPSHLLEEHGGVKTFKLPTRHLSEVSQVHFARHPEPRQSAPLTEQR
jgi:hypothetical protein